MKFPLGKAVYAYRHIGISVVYMLIGEFFLQLVNAAFFLYLNYYMSRQGYQDYQIAKLVSYRYISVILLALPLGIFIRGRILKPFFLFSSIMTPLMALVIIFLVQIRADHLLICGFVAYSFCFAIYQIAGIPFILSNGHRSFHSEAIASYFLTWSIATCLCGVSGYMLTALNAEMFCERNILLSFSVIGLSSVWFVLKISEKPLIVIQEASAKGLRGVSYDWRLIVKVLVPNLIIATGAGFTIPFINLFFLHVHGISSSAFALMGSFSYLLVAAGVLIIPAIKRRWGYKVTITLIQSLSIIFLVFMASTEYYRWTCWAKLMASLFFILRQPLMNVAGPMTSELTMYYVGERNREIVSALNAAIWSGSWFISAQLFAWLRSAGMSYSGVFLITAVFYILGVAWYYFLIEEYARRHK